MRAGEMKMSKTLPIQLLIELAEGELDAATKKLGKLQQERAELAQQLQSLIDYRAEYHARFAESAQQGMNAANWRNFQAFIETLDAAIDKQRQWLVQADARLDAARPEWRAKKQKVGSFEVIHARQRAEHDKRAARVEQRNADEHAAKVLRMRSANH
jgi:flagellar protein FliJ